MKPLNLDNRPCSPISSNCVIWQGPDIPCIKLCTGDTVSDIVYKLGTELCTIMEQLNVSNYDLSCFDLTACPPSDFKALIQLLIDRICAANGITTTTSKAVQSTCPDCVVSVAPCFIQGTTTTMQLVDYVQMIANRVCSIISEIAVINNQISNLDNRVTILENTPPPTFTLPSINTGCLSDVMSGATSATIDLVLNTLLNNSTKGYCQLIGATGLPSDLSQSVASQCVANTDDALAVPGTMASAYGPYTVFGTWNSSPVTVADAINNLWIALCDVRNAFGTSNIIVEASTDSTNTTEVTTTTVGLDTTYTLLTRYGLEFFTAGWQINSTNSAAWKIIAPNTTANGFPNGYQFIKATYVGTTRTSDKSAQFITHNGVSNYITNADFTPYGNTFGTYSADNGEFHITEAGLYMVTAHMHIRANSAGDTLWSANPGSIGIGLCVGNGNTTDMYCGSHHTIVPDYTKQIDVTAERTILVGTGGAWVRMTILNYSDRTYDGSAYTGVDGISYSIVKLREGLTTTNL